MTRYSVDCRDTPSDNNCDVKISGSEEHLVEAAAAHMVTHHQQARGHPRAAWRGPQDDEAQG